MTTKNFKARVGLEAPLIAADNGTTAITLSDNDVTVVGDLTVTSNTIKSSSATALTLSGADVAVAGDLTVTGNDIKSSTDTAIQLSGQNVIAIGTLQVSGNTIKSNGSNTAITLNVADVTVAGTLEIDGNIIKSNGGTSAILLSNADVTVAGDLTVTGANIGTGVNNTNIQIDRTTNSITNSAPIALSLLSTTSLTPAVGFGTSLEFEAQTSASNFENAGFISVNATDITATSEDFSMNFGLMTAGAAYATKLTLDSLGNLTPTGNFVRGVIRESTTQANGDIFSFTNGAGTGARGLSIDNSDNTAKIPALLLRGYTGGAVAANGTRGLLLWERARGTSAAPTAIQSADLLGGFSGNGYSSTGWLSTLATTNPAAFTFSATENWVSNTNVGTGISISLVPTATTFTGVGQLINCMTLNPQNNTWRSDAYTWSNGKTGTTQVMALDVSGNLTVTGDVRVNGGDIQNPGGTSAITLTSANTATTIKGDTITLEDNAGTDFVVIDANTAKFNVPVTTEITTTTISEGTTYTPAATVDNNISVQINTLSGGTTVIDLINLTGNSRGASYNILVFNNTASGTPIQVKNTRINSNNLTTHTITTGDRIIINAFVVGDYATATHLVVA